MGGNFLRCQHMYFVRLSLEIKPVVFQFIDQIALDIHMVGGDDIGAVGHALDLAFSGIGHAGEEVHQAAGHIFVGGFEVHDHGAFALELVGNLGSVLKMLGADQNDLELRGY